MSPPPGPYPAIGLYWFDTVDPTVPPGMSAPLGQLLIREDVPSIYYKSGPGNEDWTLIGAGSGGGGAIVTDNTLSGVGTLAKPLSAYYIDVKNSAFGAKGDGTTDDRVAIQAAIAAATALGGGTVFFPCGTYLCSKAGGNPWCLTVPANVRLLGENIYGTTILQAPVINSTRLIYVTGNDATIEQLTLDGNSVNQTGVGDQRHGVFMDGGNRVKLLSIRSQNFTGDGWYFFVGNDCQAIDCTSFQNGRNGCTIGGAGQTGVTILDCRLTAFAAQGIDSEASGVSANVLIQGCTINGGLGSGDYAITISGASNVLRAEGWSIVGNQINGCIFGVWCNDVAIVGNTINSQTTQTNPCIEIFRSSSRVKIVGNSLIQPTGPTTPGTLIGAISILGTTTVGEQSDGCVIANNTISVQDAAATGAAVSVQGAISVQVLGNTMEGSGNANAGNCGIYVRATNTGTNFRSLQISDNYIENFGQYGLRIDGTMGDTITQLILADNVFDDSAGTMVIGASLSTDGLPTVLNARIVGNTFINGVATSINTFAVANNFNDGATSVAVNVNAGTLVVGTPVYAPSAGNMDKAQANAAGTAACVGLLSRIHSVAGSLALSSFYQSSGPLILTTAQWDAVTGDVGGLVTGDLYYVSAATAGKITKTAPSAGGQFVAIVGRAVSATELIVQLIPPVAL